MEPINHQPETLPVRPIRDVVLPLGITLAAFFALGYFVARSELAPDQLDQIANDCVNATFPIACRVVNVFAEFFTEIAG